MSIVMHKIDAPSVSRGWIATKCGILAHGSMAISDEYHTAKNHIIEATINDRLVTCKRCLRERPKP